MPVNLTPRGGDGLPDLVLASASYGVLLVYKNLGSTAGTWNGFGTSTTTGIVGATAPTLAVGGGTFGCASTYCYKILTVSTIEI